MTYQEVLTKAKQNMAPNCRVCPECNGLACRGEVPGVGGVGNGESFIACREYLKKIRLRMDAVHEDYEPDTSIELFGRKFSAPFFIAPIGGMKLNYNGYMTEGQYAEMTVNGAVKEGLFAFTGDGPQEELFTESIAAVRAAGGLAVPTIKPWGREKLFERIADVKAAGCMAFAVDIDSAALINLRLMGKPSFTKSVEELREVAEESGIPFLVKGIMTGESAAKCADAGVYGIVVSNHGGRIMEDFPAPCSMLPEIREAAGDRVKIFVDGGVRSGADVFRCLALGADAVLIGRPFTIAAHGGGEEGIRLYAQKTAQELRGAMRMTDCRSLREISDKKIINSNR